MKRTLPAAVHSNIIRIFSCTQADELSSQRVKVDAVEKLTAFHLSLHASSLCASVLAASSAHLVFTSNSCQPLFPTIQPLFLCAYAFM